MISHVWPDKNKDVEYQRDLLEPSREGIELVKVHLGFCMMFRKNPSELFGYLNIKDLV